MEPDVVVMVMEGSNVELSRQLVNRLSIDEIQAEARIPVIAAGRLAERMQHQLFRMAAISAVVLGDMDDAVADYLEQWRGGKLGSPIEGMVYRHGEEMIDGGPALIGDLDSLPFADRSLINATDLIDRGLATVHIGRPDPRAGGSTGEENTGEENTGEDNTGEDNTGEESTGEERAGVRSGFRYRSPDDICDEIDELCESYPDLSAVGFPQPEFVKDDCWFEEFTSIYAERCGLPFVATVAVEGMTETVAQKLAAAGCSRVQLIADSVCQPGLKQESASLSEIVHRASQLLIEAGIEVECDASLDSAAHLEECLVSASAFGDSQTPAVEVLSRAGHAVSAGSLEINREDFKDDAEFNVSSGDVVAGERLSDRSPISVAVEAADQSSGRNEMNESPERYESSHISSGRESVRKSPADQPVGFFRRFLARVFKSTSL